MEDTELQNIDNKTGAEDKTIVEETDKKVEDTGDVEKVFSQSELDKALAKALKTREENLKEVWQKEEEAKLKKLEAEKKGEFEKLYRELEEKYTSLETGFKEYETTLQAEFEEISKGLPETLTKFIPDGTYAAKIAYVKTLKAELEEAKKPNSTGGDEIGKVGNVKDNTLTKDQISALTPAQLKMLSKEDKRKYAELYGFSVFERKN